MLAYCGECDERRPMVTLVWCEWCQTYHDYGKATPALGVADSQLLEICPACGTAVPTEASDDAETPAQSGIGDVGGVVPVPAGAVGAVGGEPEEDVGF